MAMNASLDVAGAASEHPLEGVAKDPAGVGYNKRSPTKSGMTLWVGPGLKRGEGFPLT